MIRDIDDLKFNKMELDEDIYKYIKKNGIVAPIFIDKDDNVIGYTETQRVLAWQKLGHKKIKCRII